MCVFCGWDGLSVSERNSAWFLCSGYRGDWGAPNWPFATQTSKQDSHVAKADLRKQESQMPVLPTYAWRCTENREETPEVPLSFADPSNALRGGRQL